MGTREHAQCAYCGATEGEEWVTGGRFGKIFCSRDCRSAALVEIRVCLVLPMYFLIFFLWNNFYDYSNPFIFPLILLVYSIIPLSIAIFGIRAKERVSQR